MEWKVSYKGSAAVLMQATSLTHIRMSILCNIYPIATTLLVEWVHDHLWAAGVVALDGSGPLH